MLRWLLPLTLLTPLRLSHSVSVWHCLKIRIQLWTQAAFKCGRSFADPTTNANVSKTEGQTWKHDRDDNDNDHNDDDAAALVSRNN